MSERTPLRNASRFIFYPSNSLSLQSDQHSGACPSRLLPLDWLQANFFSNLIFPG